MPQIAPLYLRPIVGYFMWYAQRGLSQSEVMERAQADKRFRDITTSEFVRAANRALRNVQATERLQGLSGTAALQSAFLTGVSGEDIVGVRVLISGVAGDPRAPTVTVTINTPSRISRQEVEYAAMTFWRNKLADQSPQVTAEAKPEPVISQLIEGGLEAPALTLQ